MAELRTPWGLPYTQSTSNIDQKDNTRPFTATARITPSSGLLTTAAKSDISNSLYLTVTQLVNH